MTTRTVPLGDHVDLYKDRIFKWRYRLRAGNNRTISTPGQSFRRKSSAVRSAKRVHPGVPIYSEGVLIP